MPAPKKKAQISVYLDPDVMRSLSVYAARREQPMSLIAEAAIASFLSPDADERREAAIAKRHLRRLWQLPATGPAPGAARARRRHRRRDARPVHPLLAHHDTGAS